VAWGGVLRPAKQGAASFGLLFAAVHGVEGVSGAGAFSHSDHENQLGDHTEFVDLIRIDPDCAEVFVVRHQLNGSVLPGSVFTCIQILDLQRAVSLHGV